MELKKINLAFLLLLSVLFMPRSSQALALSASAAETPEAPPTVSPICDVEAVVYDAQLSSPDSDYYDVQLKLSGISAYKSETTSACNEAYGAQIEKAGLLLSSSEYRSAKIEKGDTIKALVVFDSAGNRAGYFLHDVQITGRTDLTTPSTDQPITAVAAADYGNAPLIAFSVVSIMALAAMTYDSQRKKK